MNKLLQDCLNQVNPDTREEVRENMTMTRELDERARAFAKKQCDKYGDEEEIFSFYYNEYLEIAEEQKAIDIDKACEWICHNCENSAGCDGNSPYTCPTIKSIIKAMEE